MLSHGIRSNPFLPESPLSRLHARQFILLALLLAGPCFASSPGEVPTSRSAAAMTLAEHIAEQRQEIQAAEQSSQPNHRLGYLWAALAADYKDAADFVQAEDAYRRALKFSQADPNARPNYAATLSNLGNLYLVYGRLDDAAACLKKALAIRLELGDAEKAAYTRLHLANLALAQKKLKAAESEALQAYEGLKAADTPDPAALSSSLVSLAYARCRMKRCDEGLKDALQALATARASAPPDLLPIGNALLAVGFAQWKSGGDQQPDKPMLQGIELIKKQTAPGSPILYYALLQYRDYLKATHRKPELQQVDLDLAISTHRPCPECTVNVRSLASNTLR